MLHRSSSLCNKIIFKNEWPSPRLFTYSETCWVTYPENVMWSISPVTMSEYYCHVMSWSICSSIPFSESISWFEYTQTGNAEVGLTLTIWKAFPLFCFLLEIMYLRRHEVQTPKSKQAKNTDQPRPNNLLHQWDRHSRYLPGLLQPFPTKNTAGNLY